MRQRFSISIALIVFAFATIADAAPASYAARVLAGGPLGYWRLGEAPGSVTAADASGNANNGTYSGGVVLGQPGFHGGDTAALFDGKTARVFVPNSGSLNPALITMEAKVAWRGPNGLQQRILEKSSYQELAQYGLSILNDGHVRVELRTTASPAVNDPICPGWLPAAVVCANSASIVPLNVETHVIATFDGKRVRIYLDGVLDSDTPAGGNEGNIVSNPPAPGSTGRDLGIGNQTVRDRGFNGVIDEVALYRRPLSGADVLDHFQSQREEPPAETMLQYAVKFVCGKTDQPVVAPGEYFTAINVHNPNERVAVFRKKFAVALPGEKPGRISRFFDAKLGPDEAFEIDCPDILRHLDQRSFAKGFAVIETPAPLDVVAVYTAAGGTGRVETMDVETIQPRRIGGGGDGKPDLIPVPDAQGNFCRFRERKFVVTVKNQGTAASGPSTTTVNFSSGSVSQPTPPLAPGASVDLLFDVPAGCFQPDCGFKITVDSGGVVVESDETNNTATGVCIG